MGKTCSRCGLTKAFNLFSKSIKSKDGHSPSCKQCDSQRKQTFYRQHRESIRQLDRDRWHLEPERALWKGARKRAIAYGLLFTLEVSDIVIPDYCPILGLKLVVSTGKRKENSPSLDRIDNTSGYEKDNVCVVSWRANRLKGDGTSTEHTLISNWMREYEQVSSN